MEQVIILAEFSTSCHTDDDLPFTRTEFIEQLAINKFQSQFPPSRSLQFIWAKAENNTMRLMRRKKFTSTSAHASSGM